MKSEEPQTLVVEVAPGAGGQNAKWLAAQIAHMLARYAGRRGLIVGSLFSVGDAHRFTVTGPDVYRILRFEVGMHRAHHVPDSETMGRIHTSTVIVRLLDREGMPLLASPTEDKKIRTYSWPQGSVKDHRIDLIVSDLSRVLDGDLDNMTAALEADENPS